MSRRARSLHLMKVFLNAIVVVSIWQYSAHAASSDAQNATPSSQEAEGAIFQRQQDMKQLDTDAKALGDIVAGQLPPDKLPAVTQAIAQDAKDARDDFQSKIPGGRAKPEVWSNWTDFSQRMDDFAARTAAMAKLGQSEDLGGIINVMVDALPCKQCHDLYRKPKPAPETEP